MDGRNDKANNRYGLRNREQRNGNDALSINEHGSNDGEEEEEEGENNRPHQRRHVDEANTKITEKCWTFHER